MSKKNFQNQKGISIYLALLVIAIFLDLSFGLSFLLFGEVLTMRDVGNSVVAFYAADTGIERVLYMDNYICYLDNCTIYSDDCVEGCKGLMGDTQGSDKNYQIADEPIGSATYDASFATRTVDSTVYKFATATGYYQKTTRSIQSKY